MRILIAHDAYYPNVDGSSYFTQRLAFYLKKQGHDVMVVVPSQTMSSHYSEYNGIAEFRVSSTPIYINNYRYCQPFPGRTKLIREAIMKFKPDVVHIQSHFPLSKLVADIAVEEDLPLVGTNHAMPGNHLIYMPKIENLRRGVEKAWWRLLKNAFSRMDIITTPTQTAADFLAQDDFKRKVIPISCGLDLAKFRKLNFAPGERENFLEKYGIPDKPILLYLGRLDKEKEVDLIIRALPAAFAKADFHFVAAGKGEHMEDLKELAAELKIEKNITFTGFVPDDDLAAIYSIADCFVIACVFELQSIVTMQAMAAGLPVIAVDAMALPELAHHGENGFLFKPHDPHDLSKYLSLMMSDKALRQKMSAASLVIIEKHDMINTIKSFEDIYGQAIKIHKLSFEEKDRLVVAPKVGG